MFQHEEEVWVCQASLDKLVFVDDAVVVGVQVTKDHPGSGSWVKGRLCLLLFVLNLSVFRFLATLA